MKINYDGTLYNTKFYSNPEGFCYDCNSTSKSLTKSCWNCGSENVEAFDKEKHSNLILKSDKSHLFDTAKALNAVVVLYELFGKIKNSIPYKFDLELCECSNASAYITVILYNSKKNQSWETKHITLYTNRKNLAHHTDDYYLNKYTRRGNSWRVSNNMNNKQVNEVKDYLNSLIEDGTMDYYLDRFTFLFQTVYELM